MAYQSIPINISITRNKIYNAITGFDSSSIDSIIVSSNIIYDSTTAIHISHSNNLSIVGNTVDTCDLAIDLDQSANGIISSNNLTFNNHGLYRTADTSVGFYNNNLFYTPDKWDIMPNDTFGNLGDLPEHDPGYVNRSARDYHLGTGSPNIGTGQSNSDPFNTDFDGIQRW